jgi:hypothetical protein
MKLVIAQEGLLNPTMCDPSWLCNTDKKSKKISSQVRSQFFVGAEELQPDTCF